MSSLNIIEEYVVKYLAQSEHFSAFGIKFKTH
jgi:hypothetical protein